MSLDLEMSSNLYNPKDLLGLWRKERAYRTGKTLCYWGLLLTLVNIVVDYTWSSMVVVYGDLILLTGCMASYFWLCKINSNRYLFWLPMYIGFWLSMWPSVGSTGGIYSPLLGVFLAILYIVAAVIQVHLRHTYILIFVLLNIPLVYALDHHFPTASQASFSPMFIISMHLLGIFAIGVAVGAVLRTERQLAEQFSARYRELSLAREDLRKEEEANLAKTTFLANVSHELRTPLGAILGFTDLLSSDEVDDEDRKAYIEVIRRNSEQLARLVDDLLDLSRIEVGQVNLDKTAVCIKDLMGELIQLQRMAADKKGVDLYLNYLSPMPEYILTDLIRMRQILLNLISNAIKFTEKGYITVSLNFLKNKNELIVTVKDTGRGILEQEQSRLFKPFSQGDPMLAKRYGGFGLGLSLSRKLAELLGGELKLTETKAGIGSTFSLTLPVEVMETAQAPSPATAVIPADLPQARLKGKKILFADDMIDNQTLITKYLNSAGATVEIAVNGAQAIEKASTCDYDLVLMDIQMPLMDGYEAVSTLRKREYKKPILALTAHAMKEDWERCMAVGCNGHLSKPVTYSTLVNAIASTLHT
jgi:signal transduction histidine kinase